MTRVGNRPTEFAHREIGSIARGVAASAVRTLAMDASLYRGYRHDGGNANFPGWESSEGLASWENAPAPALVAKRLLEGGLKHELSPRYARLLNNATHWAFGLAADAGYGLVLGSRRTPKVRFGLPFGAAVWASGYLVLPQLGVYQPIWKYDLETRQRSCTRAAQLRLVRLVQRPGRQSVAAPGSHDPAAGARRPCRNVVRLRKRPKGGVAARGDRARRAREADGGRIRHDLARLVRAYMVAEQAGTELPT